MVGEFVLACLLNFLVLIITLSGLTVVGASHNRIQNQQCDGLNSVSHSWDNLLRGIRAQKKFVEADFDTGRSNVTHLSPANCDEQSTGVIDLIAIPNITSYGRLEIERIELKWNQADGQPLPMKNLEFLKLKNCTLNPHSIQFTGNLKELWMEDLRLVNGTLGDLFKTASQIELLVLSGKWYENVGEDRPIFLKSLKMLYLSGGWSEDNHTPFPFRFGDSLDYLSLEEMNVTVENLRSILESTRKLRKVELSSVHVTSDSLGTKQQWPDNLSSGEFIRSRMTPNSELFGKKNETELDDIELKWNQADSQPVLLNDLESLMLTNCTLNPLSIQFTENLKDLQIKDSRLINGTLEDLLKTASQIEFLGLRGKLYENEIEDRPIFLKSLKWFDLRGGWGDDNRNPLPFRFSDSLDYLWLGEMNVTGENLRSFLESATKLREVTLESVHVTYDSPGTKPLWLDNLSSAEFIRSRMNPNSGLFGKKNETELDDIEIKWNQADGQPLPMNNLEALVLKEKDYTLNLRSIQFTEKLKILKMSNSRLINGTLRDLLKTASQIEVLELDGKWYENKIDDRPISLKNLKSLKLRGGWGEDNHNPLPFRFSDSLDYLSLEEMNVTVENLRSSLESATKLREVWLWSVQVISGSSGTNPLGLDNLADAEQIRSRNNPNTILFDLLRNVTSLQNLNLFYMGEVDLTSLPSSELTHLRIWDSKFYRSSRVVFDEPHAAFMSSPMKDDSTIFDDFDLMFPKIRTLDTGLTYLMSPSAVIALFRSSATKLDFSFDFEPQIKTFTFGEAMKIMRNNGLKQRDEAEETNPDRENGVRQTRARYITFTKTTTENGTQKWEQDGEATKYYDETVEDTKPPKWKLAIYIYIAVLSILISIGIFGNTTSIIILLRRKLKNSAELILLSLTLYDGLVILTYLASFYFNARLFFSSFVETGRKATNFDTDEYSWIAEQNPVQAFLVYPLNKTGYTGSVYSTILISLERFVAICWPLQSKNLLRPRSSKLALFVIFSFSILINIPRWIEPYEWDYYFPNSRSWNEYYRPTFMRTQMYRTLYHGYLWAILMYILPFLLVGYFNFKILQHVCR